MRIVNTATIDTYSYKEVRRSLNSYHWCEEEKILIGRDIYNRPYAILCNKNNEIVRNIRFDNKNYRWRICFLTNQGVKFLRKNGLIK